MKKSQSATVKDLAEGDSASPAGENARPIRIVGFDPGLNITGYGVIEVLPDQQVRLVEAGTIRPKGKDDIEERLHVIHSGVCEILEAFGPQSMAIEQLFVHVRFPKTAILMGHARGVICLAAAQKRIELHHYLPNRVKSMLTGSGHAGKEQMQLAVQRELRLKARPEPADAADALAIALADFYLRLRALPGVQSQFQDNT